MNCIVCVTSVPDTASVIKIGDDGKHIDETGIKWIVSPYDEYALEEALKLTEAGGGEVGALGPVVTWWTTPSPPIAATTS